MDQIIAVCSPIQNYDTGAMEPNFRKEVQFYVHYMKDSAPYRLNIHGATVLDRESGDQKPMFDADRPDEKYIAEAVSKEIEDFCKKSDSKIKPVIRNLAALEITNPAGERKITLHGRVALLLTMDTTTQELRNDGSYLVNLKATNTNAWRECAFGAKADVQAPYRKGEFKNSVADAMDKATTATTGKKAKAS